MEAIVTNHWTTYGRNFYCRYDYDGVSTENADAVLNHLRSQFASLPGTKQGSFTVDTADEFTYLDPIDLSVSANQGIRILFTDGSRIVVRLSGTAGSGATIRLYLEKYEPGHGNIKQLVSSALGELVEIALHLMNMAVLTGMNSPTVIT